MKFPQIFIKTPNHKRFNFTPRFYDPQEEERKEREERIRKEVEEQGLTEKADRELEALKEAETFAYRERIAGSFRTAKKTVTPQSDPSAALIRLFIILILTVGLIAYLQYGKVALYGVFLAIVPFYLYLKLRKPKG